MRNRQRGGGRLSTSKSTIIVKASEFFDGNARVEAARLLLPSQGVGIRIDHFPQAREIFEFFQEEISFFRGSPESPTLCNTRSKGPNFPQRSISRFLRDFRGTHFLGLSIK